MFGFSKVFDWGSAFSFAHTLLGTGTHAFIGTLWRIGDAAALLFMIMFYEELQEGLSLQKHFELRRC
jgi:CHAT domain-containing protein